MYRNRLIYIVTSPSGKVYVGQTKDFVSRKKDHLYKAGRGKTTPFCEAIRKYGDQLKWEIHKEELTDNEADELEKQLIEEYRAVAPNGYNVSHGGQLHYHRKLSEGHRQKISNALKGNQHRKGVPHSEEVRKKISNSLIGNTRTRGLKHTEESIRKMSEIKKGKPQSEETRKKRSESVKKSWEKRKQFNKDFHKQTGAGERNEEE